MRAAKLLKIKRPEETTIDLLKKSAEHAASNHPFNYDYASLNFINYSKGEIARLKSLLENLQNSDEGDKVETGSTRSSDSQELSDIDQIKKSIEEIESRVNEHKNTFSNVVVDAVIFAMNQSSEKSDEKVQVFLEIKEKIKNEAAPTEWQKKQFVSFVEKNAINLSEISPSNILELEQNFIDFLTQTYLGLPATYQIAAEEYTKFPSSFQPESSGRGHIESIANKKILSIGAPIKSSAFHPDDRKIQDQKTLNAFIETLTKNNVKRVFCLGALKKHKQRIDYKDALTENKIELIEIDVADNKSLSLSNDTLRQIISAFNENGTCDAVHCDSGVGRTGQFRLLLALLDKSNRDLLFANSLQEITPHLLPKNNHSSARIESQLQYIYNQISNELLGLRAVRYCVQTEEQFINTLHQLLLMKAVQNSCENEKINALRTALNVTCLESQHHDDLSNQSSASSDESDSESDASSVMIDGDLLAPPQPPVAPRHRRSTLQLAVEELNQNPTPPTTLSRVAFNRFGMLGSTTGNNGDPNRSTTPTPQ